MITSIVLFLTGSTENFGLFDGECTKWLGNIDHWYYHTDTLIVVRKEITVLSVFVLSKNVEFLRPNILIIFLQHSYYDALKTL